MITELESEHLYPEDIALWLRTKHTAQRLVDEDCLRVVVLLPMSRKLLVSQSGPRSSVHATYLVKNAQYGLDDIEVYFSMRLDNGDSWADQPLSWVKISENIGKALGYVAFHRPATHPQPTPHRDKEELVNEYTVRARTVGGTTP